MSGFRAVLVICLMGVGVSGCVTAAASLALTAVGMATGGDKSQTPFKNPMDQHTTGRQVREALSRLDDQVDPACQQMLDEHHAATPMGAKPAGKTDTETATEPASTPAPAESERPATPIAKPGGTGGAEKVQMAAVTEATSDVAVDTAPDGGPGACEHRLVCLPGTPKPTLMLMCPGKDMAENSDDKASEATTEAAAVPVEPAPAAPEKGGLADWNWSQDPAKQL